MSAIVALNSFGEVDPETGLLPRRREAAFGHTTIGVIATNATLDKVGCLLVSQSGHDGLARAIDPAHTTADGDAFVTGATAAVDAHIDTVRSLAAWAVADAIRSAVAPPGSGAAHDRDVTVALEELTREAMSCTRCPLAEGRTNVVFGVGDPNADLLFVGEGPGRDEDLQGEPFVGRSGQLLDRLVFEEMGLTRDRFYIANVVMCRPPGNRDPLPAEIDACSPFLEGKLNIIRPRVVVTLGNFATKLLLHTSEGITKMRGRTYPYREGVLIPTFHPAAVLRGGGSRWPRCGPTLSGPKPARACADAPHEVGGRHA